jgi:peptidoglycan/xylan/chitin deacetylase (PgdA/CDA1 family)
VGTDRYVAALTFDDGPALPDTRKLLDVLGEAETRATFFVRGGAVDNSTEALVAEAAAAGHEIANHTHSHLPYLGVQPPDVVAGEIRRTHDLLTSITGSEPTLIRPPYGHCLDELDSAASGHGYRATIHWSVVPSDWKSPGADRITRRVLARLHPGAIILLHDGAPPDQPDASRRQTVDAVRSLLRALKHRGYALLTVSQLLDCGQPMRAR